MRHYRFVVVLIGAFSTAGCIIDEQRCDAHQVEISGDFALCVCEPNAVFNASGAGCTPCAENEVVANGVCACAAGFAKPSADAGCMASSVGSPCSATVPCMAAFPYCVLTGGTEGYCSTQGCTSNADCAANYTCETQDGSRYCKRPPTGFGSPCASNAECASFEANYCETLSTKTCILQGCAVGTVSCPNEWACCDFSALLGSPLSVCAAPATLVGGNCPSGGTRVNP